MAFRRSIPVALALVASVAGTESCGHAAATRSPAPSARSGERAARDVLAAMVNALDTGRFEDAYALLSARWRAAYSAGQLGLDFLRGGPAIREQTARVAARLAAGDSIEVSGDRARLTLGADRTAILVWEAGGWRVDALDQAAR